MGRQDPGNKWRFCRKQKPKRACLQAKRSHHHHLGGIKTSAVEIERVCNRADGDVLETAAISTRKGTGGPKQLVVMEVLKDGSSNRNPDQLRAKFQQAIQKNLNPLFKVSSVKIVAEFPRTASNKLLRRVLRDQLKQELHVLRKL